MPKKLLPTSFFSLVAWFAASRLIIGALGVVGVATFAAINDQGAAVLPQTSTAALNPENVWLKWDAVWYEQIARHGYDWQLDTVKGQAASAFFPLYPTIVGLILSVAPSLSFFWTASILSNLTTFAALWLILTQLVPRDDVAGRTVAITLMSAGSFYLSIPYTEGLFLLFVVATLIATKKRHYELAGLLAGLSATTRAHGVALVAVPVLAAWLDSTMPAQRRWLRAAAAALTFLVPFGIYLYWLAGVQGSAAAFVDRQNLWGGTTYPFQALVALVQYPTRISGWLHGGFWFLSIALLIRYRRKLALGEVLFCVGALVISTYQESFHGVYRYIVPLVPLTMAIAEDRDDLQRAFVIFNIIFGVVMILAFVTGNRLTV